MNNFLAENIIFEDPAFGILKGEKVKMMWQFLTEQAKDFSLQFEILNISSNKVLSTSTVSYTFSATKQTITNVITTTFTVENDKIVHQVDDFDLKKWSKQAFGNTLGGIGGGFLFKIAFQKKSNAILNDYIKNNTLKI